MWQWHKILVTAKRVWEGLQLYMAPLRVWTIVAHKILVTTKRAWEGLQKHAAPLKLGDNVLPGTTPGLAKSITYEREPYEGQNPGQS